MDSINRNLVYRSMANWHVPREWADVMYRYLVHGLEPGSMFTAMLANDARGMIGRSHPSNTIEALKAVAGWITDVVPAQARDSYPAVYEWCRLQDEQRHAVLVGTGLVLSPHDTTMALLKRDKATDFDVNMWYVF